MSNNTITDGTATFLVRKIGGSGLIKGIIMAFSGTFDSNGYPIDADTNTGDTGWHICDGTNGTPDLRGRFILGASGSHAVGSTGGEENHTLTIEEMPSHKHKTAWSEDIAPWGTEDHDKIGNGSTFDYDNTWPFTSTVGGDKPHNNMPPYYALSYIMKI